jgi:hypothetical protein
MHPALIFFLLIQISLQAICSVYTSISPSLTQSVAQAGHHLKRMPLILIEEGHNMFLISLFAHMNSVHKNPSNKMQLH